MGDEWQIDLKIPDIGSMITLFAVSVCSAILSSAEIAYTMMWITSAYVRNGKDFFIDLINAQALTWTAEFVLVAGSLLLMSSLVFLITMVVSLFELNGIAKEDKKTHLRIISGLFAIGLVLLVLALVSAILLRYL
ncbi:MAG: hypothetical protein JXA98_03115 [Methanosarcinaceae archaeon]|nr:hypothetical protein [Methanosarcinaceae archaeon]